MKAHLFFVLTIVLNICSFASAKTPNPVTKLPESLMIVWPENDHWKSANDQENSQQHVIQLLRSNETADRWTEMGMMSSVKGLKAPSLSIVMEILFKKMQDEAPKAKLTLLEKDEKSKTPWIIFTMEAPSYNDDPKPESQLWYVIQGEDALYENFWSKKVIALTENEKSRWTKIFKASKVVRR